MPQETEIRIPPAHLADEDRHLNLVASRLRIPPARIQGIRLIRRSIDARKRSPLYVLRYRVWTDTPMPPEETWDFPLQKVDNAQPVGIVGFGPAGMFAALKLIELGYKPIVLERGKEVRGRRRDLAAINKEGIVNPESNYCFGEGGAGTFSDGKLYTRSHKRGNIQRILEILVRHGATRDILIDAHPHIGTNKLPKLIQSIRATILECGGEVRFNTRVDDFILEGNQLKGVKCAGGEVLKLDALILATGHSARDIFHLFPKNKLDIEYKSFALGLRVEHPQPLIDKIQWNCEVRPDTLPAAPYSLVSQVMGRGVFSFCMCPGGIICPAATAEGEVVVNGWSPSRRDSPYANSGIVVEVKPEDLQPFQSAGEFAGLEFQASVEKAAFRAGGGKQVAPAQRLIDFTNGKTSATLPDCSYLPGLASAELGAVLPKEIYMRLQQGFRDFGKKMKGYLTNDAVVVGVESRTSSPLRIPRDRETLQHPQAAGLFPCGEGAGYAGGIMSAAMDGERCAVAAVKALEG